MPGPTLNQLERDVEAARAKLASDLATLRSPITAAEFTDSLKQEAVEAKDALLDKAKKSVQSSIELLMQDIKARAAANPTAALAIGAGVAWRLIRQPPIATALVGAGLVSLFRTPPARVNGEAAGDYFSHAKTRFLEQASEYAEVAKEKAETLGETVWEKTAETAVDIKDRLQESTAQAASVASEAGKNTQARAHAMWNETIETLGQAAGATPFSATSGAGHAVNEPLPRNKEEGRDKLLLGTAGLAVITALGIACQRRLTERR